MLDPILNILLGCVIIVISVWAGILSVKSLPQAENKPLHFWVLVGCGCIAFILTVLIGFRNYYAQKDANTQKAALSNSLVSTSKNLDKANETLNQSRLSEEYIKGQLNGLSISVGRIGQEKNGGLTELAKVLHDLSVEPLHPSPIMTMPDQHAGCTKEISGYQTGTYSIITGALQLNGGGQVEVAYSPTDTGAQSLITAICRAKGWNVIENPINVSNFPEGITILDNPDALSPTAARLKFAIRKSLQVRIADAKTYSNGYFEPPGPGIPVLIVSSKRP